MNEIDQLRYRIAELERLLGIPDCPRTFAVGALEWKLFGLLTRRRLLSREVAYLVIYGDRPEADQPAMRMVDMLICRLRQALKPHGITIQTERPTGYYLDEADHRRAVALVGYEVRDMGPSEHSVGGGGNSPDHDRTVYRRRATSVYRSSMGMAADSVATTKHRSTDSNPSCVKT